jgi:hypothetical protein
MNCKALLVTESKDATAVACALHADNVRLERLLVSTHAAGGMIVSTVESQSLGTLLASVDDLLSCQITSEGLM